MAAAAAALHELATATSLFLPGAGDAIIAAVTAALAAGGANGRDALEAAAAAAGHASPGRPPPAVLSHALFKAAAELRAAMAAPAVSGARAGPGPGPSWPAAALAAGVADALVSDFIAGAPLPPALGGVPLLSSAAPTACSEAGAPTAFLPAVDAAGLEAELPYFIEGRAAAAAGAEAAAVAAAARAAGGGRASAAAPAAVALHEDLEAWVRDGGVAALVAATLNLGPSAPAAGGAALERTHAASRCALTGVALTGSLDFQTVVLAAGAARPGAAAPTSAAVRAPGRVRSARLSAPLPARGGRGPAAVVVAVGVVGVDVDLRAGAASTPFHVWDDHGLAAGGPPLVGAAPVAAPAAAAGRPGGRAVSLPPGSAYELSVLCSSSTSPCASVGLATADVVAVLAVPGVAPSARLPRGAARVPGPGLWAAAALGLRAGAARLPPHAAAALAAGRLSPAAPPFAPPALRSLFHSPPSSAYVAATVPWPVGGPTAAGPSLAAAAWWAWGGLAGPGCAAAGCRPPPAEEGDGGGGGPVPALPPPPPAASLRGVGAQRSLALASAVGALPPAAARLARLIAAEEAAAEAAAGEADLFFAPAAFVRPPPWPPGAAAFSAARPGPAGRPGGGGAPPPPPPPHASPFAYAGPDLVALTGGSPDAACDVVSTGLLLLDVPGAPEGAPALCLGDAVHLRPAGLGARHGGAPPHAAAAAAAVAHLGGPGDVEYAALVVCVDGSSVACLPPAGLIAAVDAFAAAEAAAAAAGAAAGVGGGAPPPPPPPLLFHVRFAPGRAAVAAGLSALVDPIAGLMLPPLRGNQAPPPPVSRAAAAERANGPLPSRVHAAADDSDDHHHHHAAGLPSEADVLAALSDGGARPARGPPPPVPPPSLEAVVRRAASLAASPPAGPTRLNEEQRLAVAAILERPFGLESGRDGRLHAWRRAAEAAAEADGGASPASVAAAAWAATTRPPHVLAGPPGTGKTVTLVEAALQALATWPPGARVLAAAPAPYAADRLAVALGAAGLRPGALLRACDPARPPSQAAPGTLPYCLLAQGGAVYAAPTRAALAAARVVVVTCAEASLLLKAAVAEDEGGRGGGTGPPASPLRWDLVLVDEAGQALAPSALIPLTLICPGGGAALVGDARQLGPPAASAAAACAGGLGDSLLELWLRAAGDGGGGGGGAPGAGALLRNYRAHAALLSLPARLFYESALVPAADQAALLPPAWAPEGGEDEDAADAAPTPRAATLFYGVRGEAVRPSAAQAWANPVEAATVAGLVEALVRGAGTHGGGGGSGRGAAQPGSPAAAPAADRAHRPTGPPPPPGPAPPPPIAARSVGVICLYRLQVRAIRAMLRSRGLGAVRVGTVDDFQGQEADAVVLSTVHAGGCGGGGGAPGAAARPPPPPPPPAALTDARRFNVAITRARRLLVVVGDPVALAPSPPWRELMRHAAARGSFLGAGAEALGAVGSGGGGGRGAAADDDWWEAPPPPPPGPSVAAARDESDDSLAAVMDRIASLALLGAGSARPAGGLEGGWGGDGGEDGFGGGARSRVEL